MIAAWIMFVAALIICVYVYFGYPFLIWILGKLRPRPVDKNPSCHSISIIVPAYNEEDVITAKIRNCLALDYDKTKMEILVVSDGSTDNTETVAKQIQDTRIKFLSLERRGKAHALNEAADCAQGEILVFTDANVMIEPQSIIHLVGNFADPEVGGVCGNKKYRSTHEIGSTAKGEKLYWKYDKWVKNLESRLGSIFAADGSLYAIRRKLYVHIDDPAQADDIAISVRVVLQGFRLVYEPEAVAYEKPSSESQKEFKRKIRITNHSVRALLNLKGALWNSGFYSVELLSHKFLRHLLPFPLLLLFGSNILLLNSNPLFLTLFCCQGIFCVLALVGYWLRENPLGQLKLLCFPFYFCLANTAALLGVLSILRGRRIATWESHREQNYKKQ
jgi:cellulose synthase/poly-beta-1,6-N-acetylglucosamine synthase-like glycosyltransferase